MKRTRVLLAFIITALSCLAGTDDVLTSTTLPSEGRPEHLFTLMNGNGWYANSYTSPTQNADNAALFAFYQVEGKDGAFSIYDYSAGKWMNFTRSSSYQNGAAFVKLADRRLTSAYWNLQQITVGGERFYQIAPYTTTGVAGKYLNFYGGVSQYEMDGTKTLGLWEQGGQQDAGSRWAICEVVTEEHDYTVVCDEDAAVYIAGKEYHNGDAVHSDCLLSPSAVVATQREGSFAVVRISNDDSTIRLTYIGLPAQPETAAYTRAVVYPMQQDEVGTAMIAEEEHCYTLYNKVLAASFALVDGALYFAGSQAMDLQAGTEPFTVSFGSGTEVAASQMKLVGLEVINLDGSADAAGGAEHYDGEALVARYEHEAGGGKVDITWRAVLRDGSHYLRTEMELTGHGDVDMYNVVPMIYNVDTRRAGSVPAVVGNTRGAVLLSNKIFAGLENPVAYNTVGSGMDDEDKYDLTQTLTKSLTAASWTRAAEDDIPYRVVEVTGAQKGNICEYRIPGVELKANQRVEVTIEYTSGSHRLNFAGADLLDASGAFCANDYHTGFSGNASQDNTFAFSVPYDGTYTIRCLVEDATESINASSKLTARILTPKAGVVIDSEISTMQGRWSRNTTLADGETWKISAVVGLVAQDGEQDNPNLRRTQKRRSFLAYSERERAVPWRCNPAYISWYELNIDRNNSADPTKNMSADQVLDVISHWKTDFYDKYGEAPCSFVIDDGWDNYGTWTFHANFPNEMRDMAEAAKEMGAGVGAWLGPVGGYGTSGNYRRSYWTNRGQSMVLSNPNYYNTFLSAAQNLTQNQGDFRFFKFDGISAQFSATGPDAGDAGNENAEGIIRLERYVRENLRRDIFFNTTVGTWASPFWYHYTDATWRQENDYGTIGNNSIDRENWITYRDRLVYQNYVQNSPICPINTLMTHGFILSSHGNVSKNMTYKACQREMRCAFACGSGMVELYNDYALMNSINGGKLWADLAECIRWQRENADVLPDSHWVGGNPWDGSKTNIYGWAAWNGRKSTLTLRNGGSASKSITLTLREALEIPANVKGTIVLQRAFADQSELKGLAEGEEIDIDSTLTLTLPASSLYIFNGLDGEDYTTAIDSIPSSVNAMEGKARTYDLSGRPTLQTAKGIVVEDGKKVLK